MLDTYSICISYTFLYLANINAIKLRPLDVCLFKVSDCQGREAKMTIWGHPGNDVSGMISRSEKVAGTCEQVCIYNL